MSQWDMVKLGEVFKVTSGGTPSKSKPEYYENGTIYWVKTGDLKKKYIAKDLVSTITEEALNNSSAKIFPKNTVLIAMYGATIGATSILSFQSSTNQACAVFLPNEKVLPEYLYYFFIANKQRLVNKGYGGAQPNISATLLKDYKFPLAPLETQQHMAKTLDLATEIIEGYRQKLTELEKLVQSVFYEMFGDGKFSSVRVEAISKKLTDGTHQSPTFTDIGVPFLFVSNIVNNEIEYKTNRFISEEEYTELIKRTPIEVGDILITVVGSYGNVAIVKKLDKFCFQRHIAYIKPDFEQVTSFFLKYALLSTEVQREIDRNVRGVAQKTLTLTELRGLSIPLPPLPLQEQFAQIVEKIEEEKALVQEGLREAEQLFGGLLQGYFE